MQNKVFGKDGHKSVWMKLFISMSGSQHQNEKQQKFKKSLSANKGTSFSIWQTTTTLLADLILNISKVAALVISVGRLRPKSWLSDFQDVVTTSRVYFDNF